MASTATQGIGVCLFFIACALIAAGMALGGGLVAVSLGGLVLLVVSCIVFQKAKAAGDES